MENDIEKIIYQEINKKLKRFGLKINDINYDKDLIKCGMIDSMTFIELILEIGKKTNINIKGILNNETELSITVNWFLKKFKHINSN